MPRLEESITIDRTPDDVWNVVGDIGGISTWLPVIAESSVSGGVRTCELEGGGTLTEQLVDRNDRARVVRYRITDSPWPIQTHDATMKVTESGSGSTFTWVTDVEPADLAEAFSGVMAQGATALKLKLES